MVLIVILKATMAFSVDDTLDSFLDLKTKAKEVYAQNHLALSSGSLTAYHMIQISIMSIYEIGFIEGQCYLLSLLIYFFIYIICILLVCSIVS